MNQRLFLYGTLRDPELRAIVAGTVLDAYPARLPDHAAAGIAGEDFPAITVRPGAVAEGLVVAPGAEARARLDYYELGFGYALERRATEAGDEVLVYFPDPGLWTLDGDWSLARWQEDHGTLMREAARDYMDLFGRLSAEDAARAFPQVRMRAASRLRAARAPSPAPLPPVFDARAVAVVQTDRPYTDYFAVREDRLAFPLFSGGLGETVKRASFMGGDAVTVLPYDPVSDSVLVIRQFRHGPFCRGDGNPWTIEPAAGRIDPEESPERTALRELAEETGIEGGELHLVGRYYPSPGAFSEYIYSYVALTDLRDRDGTLGGQEDEAEDILSHVLPFETALGMIETGAANTAPLVLSLLWLAANRHRFRA